MSPSSSYSILFFSELLFSSYHFIQTCNTSMHPPLTFTLSSPRSPSPDSSSASAMPRQRQDQICSYFYHKNTCILSNNEAIRCILHSRTIRKARIFREHNETNVSIVSMTTEPAQPQPRHRRRRAAKFIALHLLHVLLSSSMVAHALLASPTSIRNMPATSATDSAPSVNVADVSNDVDPNSFDYQHLRR